MITTMDVDHPEDDQQWDRSRRGESELERLDRNWNNLLQELRVVQTGVQLLTGFLLTLPFQQRFNVLNQQMQVAYLVTVGCSVGATVLLIAPVGIHRLLAAHRCAYAGLALLGTALTGVTVIVFVAVAGLTAAVIAGACALVMFAFFWWVLPLMLRSHGM